MAGIRQTYDKDGKPHKKWRYWYMDWQGKRQWKTGTTDPDRTQRIADSIEAQQRELAEQIALGHKDAPTSSDLAKNRPITELIGEYVDFGRAQGGRGGRPWSVTHARLRETHLKYWQDQLGLRTLADLDGVLPRVEKALREFVCLPRHEGQQPHKPTGKTLMNYAEAIHAFCVWAKGRGYLERDPLEGFARFDTTPKTERRAMTAEEIRRLLDVCAPHRRILYEVAFTTGLRANELRSLTIAHLDAERCGLRLDAAWTKARKAGFQPLPSALAARLAEATQSDSTAELYTSFHWNGNHSRGKHALVVPPDPLLYVPSHPARDLGKDLELAGIPKWGPGGKIDFHAARTAYINFVSQSSGVTDKEVLALARHSDYRITNERYAKARATKLHAVAEAIGDAVLPAEKCATDVQRVAVGAESQVVNACATSTSSTSKWSGRRDLNPRPLAPQASTLIQAAPRPDGRCTTCHNQAHADGPRRSYSCKHDPRQA